MVPTMELCHTFLPISIYKCGESCCLSKWKCVFSGPGIFHLKNRDKYVIVIFRESFCGPERSIREDESMKANDGKARKKYLISLEETRSIVALAAGILVFFCTLAAILIKVEVYMIEMGEHPLHYFTVLSNFLSAIGAAFMIPYAVEGIRKKRFVLPRWVVLFQYSGATCVAVTMVTSLALILPTQGSTAVTGTNFWLHVVTPILTVVLFQCVETGIAFTRRDSLIVLIPYWVYMAVYYVMVILIGKERGGWSDFYMTRAYWPLWVSLVLMLAMGFVISAVLRVVQNRRAAQSWKRIARAWSEDLEPTQLLIEAFGLGRYIGAKCSSGELTIPLDIFTVMAGKYDVSLEKLTKAYTKGALDTIEERSRK